MRPLSCGLGNGIYLKLRKTLNNQKMGIPILSQSRSNPKSFYGAGFCGWKLW